MFVLCMWCCAVALSAHGAFHLQCFKVCFVSDFESFMQNTDGDIYDFSITLICMVAKVRVSSSEEN